MGTMGRNVTFLAMFLALIMGAFSVAHILPDLVDAGLALAIIVMGYGVVSGQ
jgi:hypothetical protein